MFDPMPGKVEIVGKILAAAFDVHSSQGPGLLVSVDKRCLMYELRERYIDAKTQATKPILDKDKSLESGYI